MSPSEKIRWENPTEENMVAGWKLVRVVVLYLALLGIVMPLHADAQEIGLSPNPAPPNAEITIRVVVDKPGKFDFDLTVYRESVYIKYFKQTIGTAKKTEYPYTRLTTFRWYGESDGDDELVIVVGVGSASAYPVRLVDMYDLLVSNSTPTRIEYISIISGASFTTDVTVSDVESGQLVRIDTPHPVVLTGYRGTVAEQQTVVYPGNYNWVNTTGWTRFAIGAGQPGQWLNFSNQVESWRLKDCSSVSCVWERELRPVFVPMIYR